MIETTEIPKTYEEAVTTLARWQAEGHLDDLVIYACDDPQRETVRLIEVSEGFASTNRFEPFLLGRSDYFPFRSAVVLLTPTEWQAVSEKRMALPTDWDYGCWRQVWPEHE